MEIPSSVELGKARGIPIRLHITFLLILPFFAFVMAESYFAPPNGAPTALGYVWGALLAVALFVCVTLHELSHSFWAQRYGIKVRSITLWPLGGVSQMEEMPSEPRKEFLVAIVGPLTNFVIAAPLLLASYYHLIPNPVPQFREFVQWVGMLNVFLGAFNMFVPAFPMDGGRLLRSFLATRMSFVRATQYAATVGRVLAVGMALVGLLLPGNILLLLVATFIYVGATEEERSAQVTHTLGDRRVRDLMTHSPVILRPEDSLEQAFRIMVETKHVGFPVVDADGRVAGFLGLAELEKVAKPLRASTPVRFVMRMEVPHIASGELAVRALRQMAQSREEHLVVVEQGRLAGILTKTDLDRMVRILGAERAEESTATSPAPSSPG